MAEEELDGIRAAGQWRQPRPFDATGPVGDLEDRPVVSFASNDYLGLSQHPAVKASARAALDRWGTGAGSARLIVGSRPVHHELERALADWKRTEAAALFPTGFAANLGVLSTLGKGTLLLSDELNHASIIDGTRLARTEVRVFRHADPAHVDELLAGHGGPALVVTDTVFSMDGDVAPVDKLAEVCEHRGALLVLDEAHAVLGPDPDLDGAVVRVGTLSKTLGSLGGFAAGPGRWSTSSSTGPAATSSPRRRRRPTWPRPPPPSPWSGPPRGTSCEPGCGATSTAWPRATPRRSSPWSSATRRPPSPPLPPCWSAGSSCRRSDRRPCRGGRRACVWRCRPPTPTSSSTPSSPGSTTACRGWRA